MSEIDKILSTVQAIAMAWLILHYCVGPVIHFAIVMATKENK